MPRGRPRKIIEGLANLFDVETAEEKQDVVVQSATIENKPLVIKETRIAKNLIPIKYSEDLVKDIRGSMLIYPKTTQILINQSLLMLDFMVNIMDGLDKSDYFSDYPGGWKEKFKIEPPRVKIPKYTEEELNE